MRPHDEGRSSTERPSKDFAAAKPLTLTGESTGIGDGSALVVHFPLSWARALIDSADGPVPEYGSAAWLALRDESRAKVAATVGAAEKWRTPDRWADVHRLPLGRRAREIAAARRPRPGDHQGGPVAWDRAEAVRRG